MKQLMLAQVRMAHVHAEAAVEIRNTALRMARAGGCTWTELGEAMDMSRQAANRRFGAVADGIDEVFAAAVEAVHLDDD